MTEAAAVVKTKLKPPLPRWLPQEYAELYWDLKRKLGNPTELRRVIEDQITHDARKAARAKI